MHTTLAPHLTQVMIDDVKAAFKQRLGDAEWMDAGTKRAALVKLEAITDMIGYPDYIKVCTDSRKILKSGTDKDRLRDPAF